MYTRDLTRRINVRGVPIGNGAPVTVQSMTCTDTRDAAATIAQIKRLTDAGCDIVRVAVPDDAAADALPAIRQATAIPLVADIHFSHRLALRAIEAGVDKLRINPGNIGVAGRVRVVARAAANAGIPIRVGVNAGSIAPALLEKHGGPTPDALVESALDELDILTGAGFTNTVVSLKASDISRTMAANLAFAEKSDVPLHLGITEAGTLRGGTIKSAAGLGAMLSRGIGDTIRVSLTADPVAEIVAGIAILKALGLRSGGAEVISCPTCGRTCIDIISLAEQVEERAAGIEESMVIAVMGCAVNGPGEAREADYGIAGGKGEGLLFRKGEIVGKVPEAELVDALFELVQSDRVIPTQ